MGGHRQTWTGSGRLRRRWGSGAGRHEEVDVAEIEEVLEVQEPHSLLAELERRLAEQETRAEGEQPSGNRLLKEEVDAEDIAYIVGKWTGIPATKLLEGETETGLYIKNLLDALLDIPIVLPPLVIGKWITSAIKKITRSEDK